MNDIIKKIKDFVTSRGIVKLGFLVAAIITFVLGRFLWASHLTVAFVAVNFDVIIDLVKGLFTPSEGGEVTEDEPNS